MDQHNSPVPVNGKRALAPVPEPIAAVVVPAADIYEAADGFVVRLDVPAAVKDSIAVTVENKTMRVKASVAPLHSGTPEYLRRELFQRTYVREFNLGPGVNTDNISAEYADGVLTVTLPKLREYQARNIDIR